MKKLVYLTFILAALASCNKDSKQDWSGMEYFTFEISGTVTDTAGEPIKGITVSAGAGTARTGADGKYTLKGTGGKETTITVSFSDLDMEENGGMFTGTTKSVVLKYIEGRHGPYLGHFGKNGVDAELELGRIPVPDFYEPTI